jgi:hypothetical protein
MDAPQRRLPGLLRLRLGNGAAHRRARLMRVIKGTAKLAAMIGPGITVFDLQNWVRRGVIDLSSTRPGRGRAWVFEIDDDMLAGLRRVAKLRNQGFRTDVALERAGFHARKGTA